MSLDSLKPANYSEIVFEANRLFYRKTRGGENIGKIYWRADWDGDEKLLFDPATYQKGVVTTVVSFVPSYDGKNVALALSSGGAEVSEIRILNVDDGTLYPESIFPTRGPICWTLDNMSLVYLWQKSADNKSPDFELNLKTKLHEIGADTSGDIDFFSNGSYPELNIAPNEFPIAVMDETYPDYVFGYLYTVQPEMRVYYAPAREMENSRIDWKVLCTQSDSLVRGMEFHGDRVYAITLKQAHNYKLVSTRIDHPDWDHAETVLPEQKDVLQYIAKSNDHLLAVYSNGITGRVLSYHFNSGKTTELSLPMSGTVDVSCPDRFGNRFLVTISSWTSPTKWYDYDADKDFFAESAFNTDIKYPGFENLVSEEVEVRGHDGTMIPLSIIYEKGLHKDGNNSCLLEGYGAYGYSATPYFSIRRSIALKGVVLAYAHVRGGGEKGESWYRAGYKTTKPNTWKDFISCAEYLVKEGYTSPARLAGMGTSAGGILISRAITERPDLFGAAICNVGCANAIRMEFTPNGPPNIAEFGTVKDSLQCLALYEMDGVQHVQPGVKYPSVICVAGWNDPRVVAWEPGKFAAALQQATGSGKPVLMKVNYESGHFTEEKMVTFRNFADQYSFILWQTGHPGFQPLE
ncbi:MAG: prolyl oligopeptidase family serine peptidase [Bacteroidetes bacterium]|nr:prolyl oligopeptidase family serine peptidase [Bacteroidota bacterium]